MVKTKRLYDAAAESDGDRIPVAREHHEYQLYLAIEDTDHARTKPRIALGA